MTDSALLDAALAGDRRALARVLSRVEAGGEAAAAIERQVYARSAGAHVVGVTGAPGTGKSTLVGRLAQELRRRQRTVAVVAVDPSSPFSGGALLGDRVRMGELAGDRGIFVRSTASRGAAGGLAEQTAATASVLAAAGFDVVLVETVGAGQGELDVAATAQTTVVVAAPGLGDEVQALKAGILEIADILVVNKADRDGADRLLAELRFATARSPDSRVHTRPSERRRPNEAAPGVATRASGPSPQFCGREWVIPIVKTVATRGEGIGELLDAVARHRTWLTTTEAGAARARVLAERRLLRWVATLARARAERAARASGLLAHLVDEVAERRLSPPAAAEALLAAGAAAPGARPAEA